MGKVWVAASADSVPESGRACFTIRTDALVRGTDASVDMDVTVAVTQEGDYLAAGEDGQRTVTLDDGDSDAGLCLDLDDDEVSEVHGAVEVEVLSTSEGDGVVPDPARNKARVTVRDDDLPVVTMAPAANVVDEGDTAEFVLTRSGDLSEPLTVEASFVGPAQRTRLDAEPEPRRDAHRRQQDGDAVGGHRRRRPVLRRPSGPGRADRVFRASGRAARTGQCTRIHRGILRR